jgi:hypothetical protein
MPKNTTPSHKPETLRQKQQRGLLFVKETVSATKPYAMRDGWKHTAYGVFRQSGPWFISTWISGGFHTGGSGSHGLGPLTIKVRLGIKPMAVDPIFWQIRGHPELLRKNLSYRARSVGSVAGIGVRSFTISARDLICDDKDPNLAALNLMVTVNELARIALAQVQRNSFANIIAALPKPNAYEILLWTSLIAENRRAEAMALILERFHPTTPDPALAACDAATRASIAAYSATEYDRYDVFINTPGLLRF